MTIERRDERQTPETVVDVRERTSRSMRWLLALAVIVAVAVLLREPVTAWLMPRVDALMDAARPSVPASRERSAQESGGPAVSPRVHPGPETREQATAAPVAKTMDAPSTSGIAARPAARPEPVPLPAIEPLYPVSSAPQRPAAGPEGRAGLVQALRAGVLRPATGADIARWKSRHASTNGASPGRDFDEHVRMFEAYVIKDDFVIPGGLNGANAAVFLLEEGVPYPRGDAGHSVVLDLASGSCVGVVCRMLLQAQ